MVHHIPPASLDALPGLNAFTGTDFKSSIMNKGKVKALELIDVLAKLGESTEILCGLMYLAIARSRYYSIPYLNRPHLGLYT